MLCLCTRACVRFAGAHMPVQRDDTHPPSFSASCLRSPVMRPDSRHYNLGMGQSPVISRSPIATDGSACVCECVRVCYTARMTGASCMSPQITETDVSRWPPAACVCRSTHEEAMHSPLPHVFEQRELASRWTSL